MFAYFYAAGVSIGEGFWTVGSLKELFLFAPGFWNIVHCALAHAEDLTDKIIHVLRIMDKIDLGSVDDQKGGLGIAEEIMAIGVIHGLDIVAAYILLERPASLLDAAEYGLRVRLEKNDEIGLDDLRLEHLIDLLV